MLRFAYFWWDVAGRTLSLLLRFYARVDLWTGALALVGLPGLVVLLQFASWQVLLVGILVFFLYVAALAVYKKFTEVEDRKEELEKKLAERQKRRAINDLLGEMMEEGKSLRSYHSAQRNANLHAAHKWVKHTQDLIEAAFDKAQAQYFRGDEIDRGVRSG